MIKSLRRKELVFSFRQDKATQKIHHDKYVTESEHYIKNLLRTGSIKNSITLELREDLSSGIYFPLRQNRWCHQEDGRDSHEFEHYPAKFTILGPCFFFDFTLLSCGREAAPTTLADSSTVLATVFSPMKLKSSSRSSPLANLVTFPLGSFPENNKKTRRTKLRRMPAYLTDKSTFYKLIEINECCTISKTYIWDQNCQNLLNSCCLCQDSLVPNVLHRHIFYKNHPKKQNSTNMNQ